jgi:VWFA-related protein
VTRGPFLALTVALVAVLQPVHAQQPASGDRFRVQVERVLVDASVTDSHGASVTGLTAADFEVVEDGIPQTIATFSYVDIPIQMPERSSAGDRFVATDVRSNRDSYAGRLYVLVLDDTNIGGARTGEVKAEARKFVESYFEPGDLGAVAYTSGRAGASQEFTGDPQLLLAAIDRFAGLREKSTALEEADKERAREAAAGAGFRLPLGDAPKSGGDTDQAQRLRNMKGLSVVDIDDFEHSQRAIAVLQMLRKVSESLTPLQGRRKSLILFSEGLDYQMSNPFGMRAVTDVLRATQDAIDMAARTNTTFFAIDPRGLVGMTTDYMQMPAGTAEETLTAFRREFEVSQDSLRTLAGETGGFAALASNDFASTFDRIVQANSRYYTLGYDPPPHTADGKFHAIELRVKQPGMKVTARRGYAAPQGTQRPAPYVDLLASPLQQTGLSFSVHAAPFRQSGDSASVALSIEIDGDRLSLGSPANGTAVGKMELSFHGINEKGAATEGTKQEVVLNLKADTIDRIKAHGIRFNPRIVLAPGRYQLRVGARETGSELAGSVYYDLTVPDFKRESLSMSGLLITSTTSQQTPTAGPDLITAKFLPGASTSRREFPVGDKLSFYAEVYDNTAAPQPNTIDVRVRLTSEDGTDVFSADDSMPSNRQTGQSNVAGDITLEDATPGRYVLSVQAQIHGTGSASVARETVISVVP